MKKIDILGIPIFEYEYDLGKTEKILEEIKSLSYAANSPNKGNEISIDTYYNDELFDWFSQCLVSVRNMYFNPNLELVITNAWANKTKFMCKHHKHTHPNSIASGIFYLTESSTETIFYLDNPWLKLSQSGLLMIEKSPNLDAEEYSLSHKILPSKGKLIIFPSSLQHETDINKSKNTRFSISFNTFVSGKIEKLTGVGNLTLSSEPLKQCHMFKK